MLDFSTLTDEIIACQQTNTSLLTLFPQAPTNGYPDPASRIIPYYIEDPGGMNIEQRIQEQDRDTIMIGWNLTRVGRYMRDPVRRHEFTAYLKNSGKASAYVTAFCDGIVNWNNQTIEFFLTTIDDKCLPPEDLTASRVSLLIGQNFMIFDSMQITFALSEKGIR